LKPLFAGDREEGEVEPKKEEIDRDGGSVRKENATVLMHGGDPKRFTEGKKSIQPG